MVKAISRTKWNAKTLSESFTKTVNQRFFPVFLRGMTLCIFHLVKPHMTAAVYWIRRKINNE